jgi:myosin-5
MNALTGGMGINGGGMNGHGTIEEGIEAWTLASL